MTVQCPEYGCGIPFEDKTACISHLKWDHNRSEQTATEMVENES